MILAEEYIMITIFAILYYIKPYNLTILATIWLKFFFLIFYNKFIMLNPTTTNNNFGQWKTYHNRFFIPIKSYNLLYKQLQY